MSYHFWMFNEFQRFLCDRISAAFEVLLRFPHLMEGTSDFLGLCDGGSVSLSSQMFRDCARPIFLII